MLGNTIALTISGVTKTLTLVNSGKDYSAEYSLIESTGEYRAFVRHSTQKYEGVETKRHNMEVIAITYATSTTPKIVQRTSTSWNQVPGYTAVPLVAGIAGFLTATSNAMANRIEAGES